MTAERRLLGRLWTRRRDLPILVEAIWALAHARLALRLQPFRHVARRLTRPAASTASTAPDIAVQRVRWAILAAARRVPWRTVCFDQGIAAQRMLARRGVVADLVYGVRRSDQGLDAHVWVRLLEGSVVVGGEQAPLFQEMALFRPGLQDAVVAPPDNHSR
jgi:hypothetical protein